MFKGVYTALTTPMSDNGSIDFEALARLVQVQLKAGVQGFVLLGTTAETPTLSSKEKEQILSTCVPLIKGKAKIIIGAGTNATISTLENVALAKKFNPDAVLIATPYYNKPNLSGLIAHYKQVAEMGVPIVLYHIPGRTGLKLSNAVISTLLKEVPQIVGIKESDYDWTTVTERAVLFSDKISFLCGNDDLFPEHLSINASGIISAAANVLAPAFVKMYSLYEQGNPKEAFNVFREVYSFIKVCYAETNPTCIKYMLSKLGYGSEMARLPLGPISQEHKAEIDIILANTKKDFLI